MKAKRDDIDASSKRRGKPRRQPVASSSEAVELEALDFETGELSVKLRTAPSLKLSLRLLQIMGPKFYEVQQWGFQRLCKKWGYEPKGWKAEAQS